MHEFPQFTGIWMTFEKSALPDVTWTNLVLSICASVAFWLHSTLNMTSFRAVDPVTFNLLQSSAVLAAFAIHVVRSRGDDVTSVHAVGALLIALVLCVSMIRFSRQ